MIVRASKSIIPRLTLLLAVSLVLPSCGDDKSPTGPAVIPPPTLPPVTPPDPTPPPLVLTTVAQVLNGTATGEVILAGALTGPTGDAEEWNFSDGTGTIVLDFPSSHIPAVGALIYVLGTVASSEIDVAAWEPATDVTVPPTQPPVTPPDPTPPPLVLSTVAQVLNGTAPHEVILAGALTGPTSDSDEWNFSDGTGTIVLDFPSSNIPAVGTSVYVHGTVSSSEIDVIAWQPVG